MMGRTAEKPSGIPVFPALSLTLPGLRELLFRGFGELSGIQVLEPHPPEKPGRGAHAMTRIFLSYTHGDELPPFHLHITDRIRP